MDPDHYQKPQRNSPPASPQAKQSERERRMAKEIQELKAKVANQATEAKPPVPLAKNLQKLKEAQKALEEAGQPIPETLSKSIKEAQEAKQPPSDLKVVLGQVKAAENSCKQAAALVERLQTNLEAAKQKALACEEHLLELKQQQDKLLAEQGWGKPNLQEALPQQPEGLSTEDKQGWHAAVQTFQANMEQQKKELEKLLFQIGQKYSAPPSAQQPEEDGGDKDPIKSPPPASTKEEELAKLQNRQLATQALAARLAESKKKEEDKELQTFCTEQDEEINKAAKKQKGQDGSSVPSSPSTSSGPAKVDGDGDANMQG